MNSDDVSPDDDLELNPETVEDLEAPEAGDVRGGLKPLAQTGRGCTGSDNHYTCGYDCAPSGARCQ